MTRQRRHSRSPAPREREGPAPSLTLPRKRGRDGWGREGEGAADSPSPGSLRSPPSPAVRERAEAGREREGGTRCGYVALIGAPNAGKSTLLNRLVGRKLAIVTPKVQTTRTRLLGIVVEGAAQLVFVDTPGIFAPRRRLDRAMVAAAWAGAADADATVLLVDADTEAILSRLGEPGGRTILALNKIDLVRRDALLGLADALSRRAPFERV